VRRTQSWLVATATLGLLLWFAGVVTRYQRVETLQPLLAVGKVAGWLIVFSLACLGAGRLVWRWAGWGKVGSPESLAISLVSGAGVLMAAAAAASACGVLLPPVLLAVLVAATASGAHWLARAWLPGRVRIPTGLLLPCGLLMIAVLSTLPILAVLSPFYDQFNYHLAFPYQWLRHGSVFVYPRHSYSYLTANMGLLYCYGMAVAGPWTGQAIYWWMGAVATLGTWVLGARLGGPRAGAWAAAIFATTPTVLVPSTWASSDLGVAAFGVGGWLMLLRLRDRSGGERPGPWLTAGAMAGLAAGCKYLAIVMVSVPLGVVMLVAQRANPRRALLRRAGLWLAGAAVVFSPWLIRNAVVAGNPVFPFFNRLLPPRAVLASQGPEEVQAAARVARFPDDRLAPSERMTLGTFHPQGAAGAIGPVFLGLAPLALWAAFRKRRRGASLLAAGVVLGVAGWWFAPQLGRYLAPVLVVLAALTAAGWTMVLRLWSPLVRRCLTALLAAGLVWNLQAVSAHGLDRFACLLDRTSEERVLRDQVSYWPAIAFVNQHLPVDATVLLVAESRTLFLDRAVVVEDPFRTPLLVQLADRVDGESGIVRELRARGVTHVLYNREETERIAEMLHRSRYFEPTTPQGAENLRRFFELSLQPVFAEGAVTVFSLRR
jgi:hypothetical protein